MPKVSTNWRFSALIKCSEKCTIDLVYLISFESFEQNVEFNKIITLKIQGRKTREKLLIVFVSLSGLLEFHLIKLIIILSV
jgi:hypothetical protein